MHFERSSNKQSRQRDVVRRDWLTRWFFAARVPEYDSTELVEVRHARAGSTVVRSIAQRAELEKFPRELRFLRAINESLHNVARQGAEKRNISVSYRRTVSMITLRLSRSRPQVVRNP